MSKRTALIAAFVSLMPMGQTVLIGTGAVLTSAGMMLAIPEKIHAQQTRLVCDVATSVKYQSNENWKVLSNRTWYLQIDRMSGIIRQSWNFKNKNFNNQLNIISTHPSKLVATQIPYVDENDVSSMSLDLNSGLITYANHFTDNEGHAFSIHYGSCQ